MNATTRHTSEPARVAIITDRVLVPANRGNRQRIVELMAALRASGVEVTLVTLQSCLRPGTDNLANKVVAVTGQAFGGGDPTAFESPELCRATADLSARDRDAVIVEYLYLARCLQHVAPGCLRVIDPHDVIHKRREFDCEWITCNRSQEASLLSHAEVLLATQHAEKDEFAAMAPHCRVVMLPHSVPWIRECPRLAQVAGRVMMVGSSHPGNAGLIEFAERVWPSIPTSCPAATLHIHGDIADRISNSAPNVVLRGYTPELESAYDEADLFLAPLADGTGLKIKIVESLARGKAIVTTPVGAEGLAPGHESAVAIANGLDEVGKLTIKLLGDSLARRRLESRAQAFAVSHYSREAALREFLLLLAPESM